MWDLTNTSELANHSKVLWPIGFFLIGLVGSFHCISMCGPLVMATTKNIKENSLYQGGRLLGYLVLFSIMFSLGQVGLKVFNTQGVIFAQILFSLFFIWTGWNIFFRKKMSNSFVLNFLKKVTKVQSKTLAQTPKTIRSFIFGLFSLFIPCGYLYITLLGILSIDQSFFSYVLLISFFIGTLPSLLLGQSIFNKVARPMMRNYPKIMGSIFIIIGIYTIQARVLNNKIKKLYDNKTNQEQIEENSCH